MLYEITYILKPELTEEEQASVNSVVNTHITNLSGMPQEAERTFSTTRGGTDENNLRKFAYPIKHYRQGYYYTNTFELDPSKLQELDTLISRESAILRFLIVKDFVALSDIAIEESLREASPVENTSPESSPETTE
jgi:small subunit ribosomal protein S6